MDPTPQTNTQMKSGPAQDKLHPPHEPIPEPPILTLTRDITVRSLRPSDAESLAQHGNHREMWLNGPDIIPYPYKASHAQDYIRRAMDIGKWQQSGRSWAGPALPVTYAVAVYDVAIGSIGVRVGEDVRARGASLGFWIGKEHWGDGIMTEVAVAFVEWVWETFPKIVRLDAEVYDFNPASGRVLQKVGFEHLTTLKCGIWKDGKLAGLELWGLVRPGL